MKSGTIEAIDSVRATAPLRVLIVEHSREDVVKPGRIFSHRFVYFFVVDTCVLRCYKPQKDKLFGGESPNELYKQSRVRPQTCLAGQAC